MSEVVQNNALSGLGKSDVKVTKEKVVYDGFFKMNEYHFKHKLFSGEWSGNVRREIFERGHAVAVLPYDPIQEEFVLIEQFRFGAMATSNTPWLVEVIAGMIDKGQTPDEVCKREAMEEAGIELEYLTKVLSYLSSPGGTTERLHIYIAKVDSNSAQGIHGLETESEDIRVLRVPEEQAIQWLRDGVIDNAAAIIALQWFMLNKSKLIEDWLE